MKHKTIAYLIFATFLFSQAACHKCVECTEYGSSGVKSIEWPEVCGKKGEIDDYRKHMEEIVDPGGKVECKERKTTLF